MRELKGIDVFGGNRKADGTTEPPIEINWKKVKQSGIDFAILRITELYGTDLRFKRNANRCEARGIPYGVYRYSYALTVEDARKEARDVVKLLKGRKPSLPVFYDLEWNVQRQQLSKERIEAITLAFFDVVTKAGYAVGVYCNVDWYRNVLTDRLKEYPLWIASYPDDDHGQVEERLRPNYPNVVCWQYSRNGQVPGINRGTDMDIWYQEEPERDPDEDAPDVDPEPEPVEDPDGAVNAIRTSAVNWMVHLAEDDSHGYDQRYRWGEKGDYDCSAAVITAYQQAGIPVKDQGATYTGNMRSVFLACGFVDVTDQVNLSTGNGLLPGDVLLNQVHHTALYIGNGKEAEASINENGGITGGQPGDQTGREVLVRAYRNYPWDCVLRYTGGKELISNYANTGKPSQVRQFVGKVSSASVAVRTWAGAEYDTIKSYPLLARGDLVDVCDEVAGYYYVKVADKYWGFVDKSKIEKA